jgi:hypothetical protein
MPTFITGATCAESWAQAISHLVVNGGTDASFVVCVREPCREFDAVQSNITNAVDALLEAREGKQATSVATVANTIFPTGLYHPTLPNARTRLYQSYEKSWPLLKRLPANQRGTYFRRMTAYPAGEMPFNQLEHLVTRMQRELQHDNPKQANYELSIRVPDKDRNVMGFPCLSHVSLTLKGTQVHLAAVYRNQHFIRKALGNYLGLSRLLAFVCREVNREPGSLTCLAAHADAELGAFGKGRVKELVDSACELLEAKTTLEPTAARAA